MLGGMSNNPLLISQIIEYAAQYHGDVEIVSRTVEGPIHRYTYADSLRRSKQAANAIIKLGAKFGDRVATLAFNTYRHFELYYGISGIGRIMHTLNPRLFEEQLIYVITHAEDQIIFTDLTFVPILAKIRSRIPCVKHIIVLTDSAHMPKGTVALELLCYEDLLAQQKADLVWPEFSERTPSLLCYTSGTTGNPKGVLYEHRSTVLHTLNIIQPNYNNLSSKNTVMPVVPMFHVNAWGIVYASPLAGAKIVFPGPKLDGESIYSLMEQEKTDQAFGVPSVWLMLLQYCEQNNKKLSFLKKTVIGGSAVPRSMIEQFVHKHGVEVYQGWGMTEMSPLGSVTMLGQKDLKLPLEKRLDLVQKAGRPVFMVDMRITSDDGKILPWDGKSVGNLEVRGPYIVRAYFKNEDPEKFTQDGWFKTGDVVSIDPEGWIQITDRTKDVIKSGGEWISSIEVENFAMGHPKVHEAAVVGLPHPKWDERPMLVVVLKPGQSATKEELLNFLSTKISKWWLPNDVHFVNELPHGATGKVLKREIREIFKNYQFPDAKL